MTTTILRPPRVFVVNHTVSGSPDVNVDRVCAPGPFEAARHLFGIRPQWQGNDGHWITYLVDHPNGDRSTILVREIDPERARHGPATAREIKELITTNEEEGATD